MAEQKRGGISKATIDRLPLYFRTLRLAQDEGIDVISSEELGRRLGITPEQIRKDLASFGQFGKKGVGYYVNELKRNVGSILGLDHHWNIAIVGIGHLGAALANYQNFVTLGFNLVALFDQDPKVIGTVQNHVKVEAIDDLSRIVRERGVGLLARLAGQPHGVHHGARAHGAAACGLHEVRGLRVGALRGRVHEEFLGMRRHAGVSAKVDGLVQRDESVAVAVHADPAGEGQVAERGGQRPRSPLADPRALRQVRAKLEVMRFERERDGRCDGHVAQAQRLAL